MTNKKVESLIQYKRDQKKAIKKKIIKCIDDLLRQSEPLNIAKVAKKAGVARTTIYRDPEIRDLIDKFRETSVLRKNRAVKLEKELSKERSFESKLQALKIKLKEEREINAKLKEEIILLKGHIESLIEDSKKIKLVK